MAVIDSLRAKLRLANFFAEREEYADAFEQLRLLQTRLAALRVDFPTAASLRTIRQQHADALTSITSYCQAARQVALGRGENPPLCR
jgi:vacuolar-type H+-ATPase subunit B/Vma2